MARRINRLQINALNQSNNRILTVAGGDLVYEQVGNILIAGTGITIEANGRISFSGETPVADTANVANTVLSISNFTTSNLAEGSNLYFTNSRVLTALETQTISNIFANAILSYGDIEAQGNIIANGLVIRDIVVSDAVLSGNITASGLSGNTIVVDIVTANTFIGIDTDQVTEGTSNLYFTNARAVLALAGQNVSVNNLTVDGDLAVLGNAVTLNTQTLVIEDKNIILANGAANASIADGAGINIDGAQANITYQASGDKFLFNRSAEFLGNITANTYATSGTGIPTINSSSSIRLNANGSAGGAVVIQNSPIRIRGYTESQIANIIASTGDMVFNTSNSKLMIYNGTNWVDNSLTGVVSTTSVSDNYDIRINNQENYLVTNTLSTAVTISNDTDYRYLLHSFVITNISSNDAYVNIDLQYSGNTYKYANSFSIPYGYSVDLVGTPEILNPNTLIKIQALNNSYQPSNDTLASYITYRTALDPSYNLVSTTIDQTDTYKTIYSATANTSSIVDHIRISNHSANNLRGTLILTDSSDTLKTYIAANTLLASRYYSELLINPLRMNTGDKLKFINFSAEANCMTSFVSYRNSDVEIIEQVDTQAESQIYAYNTLFGDS